MIQIQLDTGPRGVAEANAGTREQGRELALAYMWQIYWHMHTGPRMDAEAIPGAAQIHSGRGLTPTCQWGLALSSHMSEVAVSVCFIRGVWGSTEVGNR